MLKDIFKDLKIVEISNILAGPLVGSFFGELGSEVIKIENPRTGGDITRQWKSSGEEHTGDLSAYYLAANNFKEVRFYDLEDSTHFANIKELIASADILITNLKQDSLGKFKLSAQQCSEINPELIYAQLTSYDDSSNAGFDIALQAETGFISMSGIDKDHLTKMPVALIDVIAAHHLKEAILIALLKRCRDKKFLHIKVSLWGAALTSLVNQATNYTVGGIIPVPIGLKHPNIAPYGEVLDTKDDKKIVLAIGTTKQYNVLLDILKLSKADISIYQSNDERIENRNEVERILKKASIYFTCKELLSLLKNGNVPCGEISDMQQVWESDAARPYLVKNNDHLVPKNVAFEIIEIPKD